MLMMTGLACLFTIRKLGRATPVLLLCLPAAVYPAIRARQRRTVAVVMVQMAESTVGRERAQSSPSFSDCKMRTSCPTRLCKGSGGAAGPLWTQPRVERKYGKDISRLTDGEWIIALGESGVIGAGRRDDAVPTTCDPPLVALERPAVGRSFLCGRVGLRCDFEFVFDRQHSQRHDQPRNHGRDGRRERGPCCVTSPRNRHRWKHLREPLPLRKTGPRMAAAVATARTAAGPPELARAAHLTSGERLPTMVAPVSHRLPVDPTCSTSRRK